MQKQTWRFDLVQRLDSLDQSAGQAVLRLRFWRSQAKRLSEVATGILLF